MSETKDDSPIELSAADVAAFRLRHHHLLRRAPLGEIPSVAGDVCGIQAQVESAAKTSLWARVEGLTREDVDRALLEDRTLVKLWVMRGTVHLVSTDDLDIYVAGLQKEGLFRERQWMSRYWGMTEEDFPAISRAAEEALASGPLTRSELGEAIVDRLGERTRKWVDHGYGGVIRLSTIEGKVCFGPNRGREITFVLVKDWLGPRSMSPPEQEEDDLLRRYLHAFGPATPHDFATWSGMRMGIIRQIWDRVKDEIRTVRGEGREAQVLVRDLEELQSGEQGGTSVRLLPYFDTYLLGHRGKEHLVDPAHYKRVYRAAGWISQVVLLNGRAAGVWAQKARKNRLTVTVEPFERFDAETRQAVEEEAADLGRFLEREAEVTFAP